MITRRSFFLGSAALAVPCVLSAADEANGGGVWSAVLVRGSVRLHLRFEIGPQGKATLYSLDQGTQPILGRVKTGKDGKIRLQFRTILASYTGHQTDADRIEGTWKQAFNTPLVLMRGEPDSLPADATPAVSALTPASLSELRKKCAAPAIGAAVLRRTDKPRAWVDGMRAVGTTTPAAPTDIWHVGSISKSITATLLARLVDRGVLNWDLRVGDVLNAVAPQMQESYRATTFRHLLSHRSGLPGDVSMTQLVTFQLGNTQEIRTQRRRFAQLALRMKPIAAPEALYQYSNCGYVVAGAMMEAVTGQSWEELMQQHVFEPLGLRSAGFGAPDAGLAGAFTQPVGHTADLNAKLLRLVGGSGLRALRPGVAEQTDNPRVLGPAATVHMCLDDLLTYLAVHRDASPYLKPETWRILHTPPFGGDYAMGWIRRADGSFWHNGSNTFWYAEVQWHPDTGVAAAAVCNEGRAPAMAAVGEVLQRVVAAA